MFWNRYFIPSFVLMVIIAALHWVGSLSDYYSADSLFDVPMHFMGGAWVALFALWFIATQYGAFLRKFLSVRNLLVFVFVFGVAWEFLELALKFNTIYDTGYGFDTTVDLIMDMIGATVVVRLYGKYFSNQEIK
ncbi:MAG TPA: hypothetical protein VGE35_00860 [Candidatus Paceibacterota bacterium]